MIALKTAVIRAAVCGHSRKKGVIEAAQTDLRSHGVRLALCLRLPPIALAPTLAAALSRGTG